MKKLNANDGGCWFCNMDETDAFTMEWDSYVHEACAREQARQGNPEAVIILQEWGRRN